MYNILHTDGVGLLPVGYNQAIGGQTAQQMATQTAAVTAINPKVVCFHGGTNDLASAATTATIFSAIESCRDDYVAGGVEKVIILKILPRFGTAALAPDREIVRGEVNALVDTLADSSTIILSLESEFIESLTVDGLHPNSDGANLLGNKFAATLNSLFESTDITELNDTDSNILKNVGANYLLTGVGGSKYRATGSVATGWGVAQSNLAVSCVCSKEVALDGSEVQVISLSGTGDAGQFVRFDDTVTINALAGEAYSFCAKIEIEAGHTGLAGMSIKCGNGTTPSSTWSGTELALGEEITGLLRSPLDSVYASDTATSYLQVLFRYSGDPINAVIRISKPTLLKDI